jgi:phosphoserine phosphatase
MDSPRATALIYDFDGTLSRGNLQEARFLPELKIDKAAFWAEVDARAQRHDADRILVYMQLMLEQARARKVKLTRERLKAFGAELDFFDGLADGSWFDRINGFAAELGLELHHFVISSGNHEIIEGCPIYDRFTRVFASRFAFENGEAAWPGVAINYTGKTQFLFRINKGIDNVWDDAAVNAFTPDDIRPFPFSRMVFVGDGDTDVPTMKMMTQKGGSSVAVYDPRRDRRSLDKIDRLIAEDRVDFVAPADYTENSQLDIVIRGILGRIALSEGLPAPRTAASEPPRFARKARS